MTTWHTNPWVIFWQVCMAPMHACRIVYLQHTIGERASEMVEVARNEVRIHREDIRCLERIERQAAEAALGLPSSNEALLDLTRTRIESLVNERRQMVRSRGNGGNTDG